MKKPIRITIPDNLSKEDEVFAITKKLQQKSLSGHGRQEDKKMIGDYNKVTDLTTTIIVERKSKEKPIEMVKCTACGCEYQNDMFFPVYVNYGGKNKLLKYCSENCQEAVIEVCGEGRASKKRNGLKPVRLW